MLTKWRDEPRADRVIVALDCDIDRAILVAHELKGVAKWVKIGMTLFYSFGETIVKIFKEMGYKVFLDLKFFDIPQQVKGASKSATLTYADMLTVHAFGGSNMLEACVLGCEEGARSKALRVPMLLGVTVLTSISQDDLESVGVTKSIDEQVKSLAKMSLDCGLSGVVGSPKESRMLREILGEDALIVTPGVRPVGVDVADQKRVATPKESFDNGASHIVIGRPITQATHPKGAFCDIVEKI